ncbi:peptide deformylase [Nonomuraea maritima]|uniref:peptide deformylase n=1 Tax=Nonomuraea maritima TaxID=683260 RepID=UPI003722D929
MTVRLIRTFDDPVLRETSAPVRDFDKELRLLVKRLTATMNAGSGRAGVAAPQIGEPVRVIVYNYDGKSGHLVNPRLELSARRVTADEACLSAPGVWWPLERSFMVTARGHDMFGRPVTVRALSVLARVLQHEVDHLDGVLFSDHLEAGERERFLAAALSG